MPVQPGCAVHEVTLVSGPVSLQHLAGLNWYLLKLPQRCTAAVLSAAQRLLTLSSRQRQWPITKPLQRAEQKIKKKSAETAIAPGEKQQTSWLNSGK